MQTRLIACALVAASPGASQEAGDPMSAIGWLSQSVTPPAVSAPMDEPAVRSNLPAPVAVMPLDAVVPDDAGWLAPQDAGVPRDLWGRSSSADLAAMLSALTLPDDAPPSLRAFVRDLVVMDLTPPIDAATDDALFLARADKLLSIGQLDVAKRLLSRAGAAEPERFRRLFDIALLQGTESEACGTISDIPEISPTIPARIFCLARNGQWEVAALTLGTADALDLMSPDEETLFLHFLDPELFEGEPIPRAPRVPTPLTFRLYEAVGERLSTEPLPVAFAVADVSDTVGWKARLRAVERLASYGAISVETFVDVMTERVPSASGGVFDRAATFQTLHRALARGTVSEAPEALVDAWQVARTRGYAATLAPWIAAQLDPETMSAPGASTAFEVALMADDVRLATRFVGRSAFDAFLLAVARGDSGAANPPDDLGRAVRQGLAATAVGSRYAQLVRDDRAGEALLRALDDLADGAVGNPDATAQALGLLTHLGMRPLARRIAVELMLAEGAA